MHLLELFVTLKCKMKTNLSPPKKEEVSEPIKIHHLYQNIILPKKACLQIKVGTLYLVKILG